MKCRCVITNSIHKTPQPSTGSANEETGYDKNNFINWDIFQMTRDLAITSCHHCEYKQPLCHNSNAERKQS